jgi:hypothetical protein
VGQTAMETDAFYHPNSYFVSQGKVAARSALTANLDKTSIKADGNDTATIAGLPNPTVLYLRGPHGGEQISVTDGSFVLTTTWPGTYQIRTLDAWPFLPASWSINAT